MFDGSKVQVCSKCLREHLAYKNEASRKSRIPRVFSIPSVFISSNIFISIIFLREKLTEISSIYSDFFKFHSSCLSIFITQSNKKRNLKIIETRPLHRRRTFLTCITTAQHPCLFYYSRAS